jgi:hypothetical protein
MYNGPISTSRRYRTILMVGPGDTPQSYRFFKEQFPTKVVELEKKGWVEKPCKMHDGKVKRPLW